MIHFKNLKSGFSFIEIMVALTLLGIFGSSLFLVQSNMFAKVFKTHQTLFFHQDIVHDLLKLKNKIHQAILQKQPIDAITVQENKKNPDRAINLKLYKISENSELKEFAKNVRIVESSATYDNKQTVTWFDFVYIPKLIQSDKKEEAKNPPNKTVSA